MQHLFNRFPQFVGFDDVFRQLDSIMEGTKGLAKEALKSWPPYNVVKTGENTYKIQLACAGFAKSDVELELDGNKLVVKGELSPDNSLEYLHKGISERNFSRSFTLADSVEVKNAEMINGILEIVLENQVKMLDNIKKITIK